MLKDWILGHRGVLRLLAVVVAIAVCAVGSAIPKTSTTVVILLVVVVVVAASSTGDRWAGILAALAGALAIDFFLMPPLLNFSIARGENIIIVLVLLFVGAASGELSLWGGRQEAAASERQGYLEGALTIADLTASGAPRDITADAVTDRLKLVLGVETATYLPCEPEATDATIGHDGTVTLDGHVVDTGASGLPADRFIALPVTQADGTPGHFRMSTAGRKIKVRAEQLRVAVLLADQFSAFEHNRDASSAS